MEKLLEARQIIDQVDAQMAQMFVRRMRAVEAVAAYKQANGLPILDAAREEQVIQNGRSRVSDEQLQQYYEMFIRSNMAIARQYQQDLLDAKSDGKV